MWIKRITSLVPLHTSAHNAELLRTVVRNALRPLSTTARNAWHVWMHVPHMQRPTAPAPVAPKPPASPSHGSPLRILKPRAPKMKNPRERPHMPARARLLLAAMRHNAKIDRVSPRGRANAADAAAVDAPDAKMQAALELLCKLEPLPPGTIVGKRKAPAKVAEK